MRNIKILEMLNDNKIEELKTELRDEIYMDSLKEIPTHIQTLATTENLYKSPVKLL